MPDLNPRIALREARDGTRILTDTSQALNLLSHDKNFFFNFQKIDCFLLISI